MSTSLAQLLSGRSLIPDDLLTRLAARIVKKHNVDPDLAERIMDQALAFLAACAVNEGQPISPSELVDIGWHAFILDTREYRAFCDRIAGRYIDHVPTDDEPAGGDGPTAALRRTTAAIEAAGYAVDTPLWALSADCSQCHNGCADDPPPARR